MRDEACASHGEGGHVALPPFEAQLLVRLALAVREKRLHALAGELVGALVVVMAVMALDPVPADVVPLGRLLEPLPQLDIAHRLLIRRAPAVPLPALDPAGDAAA